MRTRKKLVAGIIIAMLGIGAAAFAYFTTTGSGTGTADVGTDTPMTIEGTVSGGDLYPGGPGRTVNFTVTSTSEGVQYVDDITLDSVTASDVDCDVSAFTMPDVDANQQIPAGATDHAITATGTLSMANLNANQDDCKNATLTLNLSSD